MDRARHNVTIRQCAHALAELAVLAALLGALIAATLVVDAALTPGPS